MTDSVVPSSTSEALASALSVLSGAVLGRRPGDRAGDHRGVVGAGDGPRHRGRGRGDAVRNRVAHRDRGGLVRRQMLEGRVRRIEREAVRRGVVADAGRQRGRDVGDRQRGAVVDVGGVGQRVERAGGAVLGRLPVTAPETTGASLVPVTVTVTVAQLRVPFPKSDGVGEMVSNGDARRDMVQGVRIITDLAIGGDPDPRA